MPNYTVLSDRQSIRELAERYMLAIDASDREALRDVFHVDGVMDLLQPMGRDAYAEFVVEIMKIIRTQHFLVTSIATVTGNGAMGTCYFFAYHRVPGNCTDEACATMFGRHIVDTDVFIGGYYNDELIRTDAGWKFLKRRVNLLWRQHLPSGDPMSARWIPRLAVLANA